MPVVDDFARAQPLSAASAVPLEILVAAKATRAASMLAWLAAAWAALRRLPVGRS